MYINLARYSRWPCRCVCVVWQHYCTDCRGYTWSSVCFCSLQVCLGVQRTIWSIGSHCTVYTSLDHISTWGHIVLCVLALHCQTFCPIICQSGNVTMECCNTPRCEVAVILWYVTMCLNLSLVKAHTTSHSMLSAHMTAWNHSQIGCTITCNVFSSSTP